MDKDRLIEQKNKEIVRLRMENDELRQMGLPSNNGQKAQTRQQIAEEVEDFLENIKIEMNKIKSNLGSNEGSIQNFSN